MRGSTVKVGEFFTAKYFDIVPKMENGQVVKNNGKIEYVIETIPYYFTYREKEAGSGASYFNNFKGFQTGLTNVGVFQTQDRSYQIYTSCTNVPFKNGGKVVISINGKDYDAVIMRIRQNTNYQNTLASLRLGTIDTEYAPILLDLA